MSLNHKSVVRNNDEYFCTACGKSWDATDRDPPTCDPHFRENAPYNGGYLTPFVPETPADPNRLLERMLVENANAAPLTRADFATVTAWLVSEIGDERRAMLVYAADRHSAQEYSVAVTGRTATMEVRRLGAMDKHGWGRSSYVELNPALLKKASKAAGREVVSLITWRRQA